MNLFKRKLKSPCLWNGTECICHEDCIWLFNKVYIKIIYRIMKWAASWQNQQNECTPSEDSDQPGHPPSPIRVFAVRMKKPWVLSYPLSAQRRLWSDPVEAQADLGLLWAHTQFVGFVTRRLKYVQRDSRKFCCFLLRKQKVKVGEKLVLYHIFYW